LIQKSDGTSQLELTNLHGDIVSTMPNATYAGLSNYSESTEFGRVRSTTPALDQPYAWLGGKQRSADTLDNLMLMGARLYNPVTGRFLSRDPIPGGNDNPYTYPPDPVNRFDLSGQMTNPGGEAGGGPGPVYNPYANAAKAYEKWRKEQALRERAAKESDRRGGKHSVHKTNELEKGKKRIKIRYDLKGKAHNGLKTPHKHIQTQEFGDHGDWYPKGPKRGLSDERARDNCSRDGGFGPRKESLIFRWCAAQEGS
jgi:RHS repeat-associated protein